MSCGGAKPAKIKHQLVKTDVSNNLNCFVLSAVSANRRPEGKDLLTTDMLKYRGLLGPHWNIFLVRKKSSHCFLTFLMLISEFDFKRYFKFHVEILLFLILHFQRYGGHDMFYRCEVTHSWIVWPCDTVSLVDPSFHSIDHIWENLFNIVTFDLWSV